MIKYRMINEAYGDPMNFDSVEEFEATISEIYLTKLHSGELSGIWLNEKNEPTLEEIEE